MNKLIIDAASEKIFLMIISNASIYNITHENTKINYEKLLPLEKKLSLENNPPNFQVKFFSEQTNLNNINCYSNELDI